MGRLWRCMLASAMLKLPYIHSTITVIRYAGSIMPTKSFSTTGHKNCKRQTRLYVPVTLYLTRLGGERAKSF
ncbi:hypothetical protein F5Y15DRAFT_364982 [Xylariaceae sp. FL0016]|nr:hypothetical protein F5Y15DRAFT_364982 [Xylariaceae sp. FL0016]